MSDENTEEEVDTSSELEMSDEDFANLPMPDDTEELQADATEEQEDEEEGKEEDKETDTSEQDEEVGDQSNAMQDAFNKAVTAEAEKDTDTDSDTSEDIEADNADEDKKEVKEETEKTVPINYEEEYKKIVAPFRANGKDMQVGSVEDALTLMKMGANYNKKMAGLKPNLKLMKMLNNNDLLDEQKLAYLIDLDKKNPEAIAKFIKDSGIDPLDIDTEKETEYSPGTYTVDDKEVELDAVLEEIQDTQSFQETIDIISNKWDDSSKKVLLADPPLIKVINDHVDRGIYGQINQIVESEKMLGRLTELSDLDAYKYVGDILQKQGAFNQATPADTPAPTAPVDQTPTKAKSEDPKLKNRRRAAGSPKGTPSKGKATFNPLAMSDEEFERAAASMGI